MPGPCVLKAPFSAGVSYLPGSQVPTQKRGWNGHVRVPLHGSTLMYVRIWVHVCAWTVASPLSSAPRAFKLLISL